MMGIIELRKSLVETQRELERSREMNLELRVELREVTALLNAACDQCDEAERERDEARAEVASLTAELAWERKTVAIIIDNGLAELRERAEQIERERDEARKGKDTAVARYDSLSVMYATLQNERDEARRESERLMKISESRYLSMRTADDALTALQASLAGLVTTLRADADASSSSDVRLVARTVAGRLAALRTPLGDPRP